MTALLLASATSLSIIGLAAPPALADGQSVSVWRTLDGQVHTGLTAVTGATFAADSGTNPLTIDTDDERTYQTMTGFGATLTDSSSYLLNRKVSAATRDAVFGDLFGGSTAQSIGLNLLRQPMGSTDFVYTEPGKPTYYTYDDTAGDTSLNQFSISRDLDDVVPMVKKALTVNPGIKVNLTSWSAPAWMKDSGTLTAPAQDGYPGTLLSQYRDAYANYLVKATQAYEAQGIPVWATSAQNEPTVGNTYNTMVLSPTQSADFIVNYFAPKLYAAGLQPRIFAGDTVGFDPNYADQVWGDAAARAETEGSSHHGYVGAPTDLSPLHGKYPYKPIYQTELAPYCTDRDFRDVLVNGTRNWAQSVISWNVALDTTSGPYHTGAVDICKGSATSNHPGIPIQPLYTIDQSTGTATPNSSYFWTGQFSKFVTPGAKRIASTSFGDTSVQDVAFLNPDGTRVVVAWNRAASTSSFKIRSGSQSFTYSLPAGAMATFRWAGATSGSPHGWGDSVYSADASTPYAGGLQRGPWTKVSAAAASSTGLGSGWNSLFTGADTRLLDYSLSVTAKRTAVGTTSAAPKYGVYACYGNSDNYIQAWLDPANSQFVTNVRLGGTNYGFSGAQALPGFNPSVAHTIGVSRSGDTFSFTVDGVAQPSRAAPIQGCQVGLVTEDSAVQFTALDVQDRKAWGASRYSVSAGNPYGGGLQTGSWIVNDTNSVESASTGASSWNSIFTGAGLAQANYTVSSSIRRVATGSSAHPKYGIYACYKDDSNYMQAWFDPSNGQFVSHSIVAGVADSWPAIALPGGFNPQIAHTLTAVKSGSTFTFSIDGSVVQTRSAALTGCQVGAVTEDTRVNYRSFAIS
ncbi:glycoside hydrolase family 30 beta sandwich domain-containing protein [Galbitalea sp. SE-J8]|uniref:glycoside hydrolase family 30 protein n=1 Tax=Galbitalea sp. SE-J8 TaxID=3054952 RepID=UPI00259D04A9|nr:glycoside hydrolase family 30 beta sandwich domain-containing protein [Galbitalea sp. SE-J8]MDM4761667.1 glycoside hydrolase family 30 beta sandwich domain-containing protein [Galbitalea sp. SE-J8]